MIDRCEALGIYLVFNAPLQEDEDKELFMSKEYLAGICYADPEKIGEQFASAFETAIEGEELEGVIIATAIASRGNVQHIDCGISILDGIAEMEGLTYNEDKYDIVTSSAPVNAENSANLPVYIYPGTVANTDGYLAGLSAQLMTGNYNVVACSYTSYSQMMTVISEAEQALGKDIKLVSVAALGADLETAMTNTDDFGSLTLDAAVIKPGTWVIGGLVVPMVNALSGHKDAYKDANGMSQLYVSDCFMVSTTEGMKSLNSKDNVSDNESWVMQSEYMDQMLGICNADMEAEAAAGYFSQDLNDLFAE